MNWLVLLSSLLMLTAVTAAEVEIPGNSLESRYCVITCDHSSGYVQTDGTVTFGQNGSCAVSCDSTADALPDLTITLDFRFHERAERTLNLSLGSESVMKIFTGNHCEIVLEDVDLSDPTALSMGVSGGSEEDPVRFSMALTASADGCTGTFR